MAWNSEAFNCERCPWGRHCDETRPAPIKQWVIKNLIESNVCLLPMITVESRFLLRLYEHYKNCLLPRAGGVLEQSNYFLEAMEILSERERLLTMELEERRARERQDG